MSNIAKLSIFFILASMAFSGASCVGRTPANVSSIATSGGASNAGDAVEYPPMASDVMKAEIKALDGTAFTLEQKAGKVVLVNLWATWCGPCIKEMPELVALHEELKGNGFEVLGLNVDDEEKGLVESFAAEQKLTYPLGWTAEGQLNDLVKISRRTGIPQSFLIDRKGRLRGTFFSASDQEVAKLKETVRKVVSE